MAALVGGVVFGLVCQWLIQSFWLLAAVMRVILRRGRGEIPGGSRRKITLTAGLLGLLFAVLLLVFPLPRLLWTVCLLAFLLFVAVVLTALVLFYTGRASGRIHASWKELFRRSKY
jgi:phosphatidylglycerophosphate synthase